MRNEDLEEASTAASTQESSTDHFHAYNHNHENDEGREMCFVAWLQYAIVAFIVWVIWCGLLIDAVVHHREPTNQCLHASECSLVPHNQSWCSWNESTTHPCTCSHTDVDGTTSWWCGPLQTKQVPGTFQDAAFIVQFGFVLFGGLCACTWTGCFATCPRGVCDDRENHHEDRP